MNCLLVVRTFAFIMMELELWPFLLNRVIIENIF